MQECTLGVPRPFSRRDEPNLRGLEQPLRRIRSTAEVFGRQQNVVLLRNMPIVSRHIAGQSSSPHRAGPGVVMEETAAVSQKLPTGRGPAWSCKKLLFLRSRRRSQSSWPTSPPCGKGGRCRAGVARRRKQWCENGPEGEHTRSGSPCGSVPAPTDPCHKSSGRL